MSVKFVNFFKSKIADVGGIGSGDTEFNLSAGDGASCPDISVSGHFYLTFVDVSSNREVVKVTGVASDTCTIVRGQDGTTPRAFSQNDLVELRLTKGALEDIQAQIEAIIPPTSYPILFGSAAAPTGWTLYTSWTTGSMLIVTNGVPGAGGSDDPKSWLTALVVQDGGAHLHTGPSHVHTGTPHNHIWLVVNPATVTDQSYNSGGSLVTLAQALKTSGNGIWLNNSNYCLGANYYTNSSGTGNTGSSGTGNTSQAAAHGHTLTQDTFTPKYQEVIAATRDAA